MKKNMGLIDRSVRALLGLVFIAMVFVGPQTPWGWIGVILLATALISWCPLYRLFGIKTCKADDRLHTL